MAGLAGATKHQNGMGLPRAVDADLTMRGAGKKVMSCRLAFRSLLMAALLAGLAACSAETPHTRGGEEGPAHDPVMTAAIEGQLLVDPDLSQANNRNLAAVPAGPADPALPLPDPKN